jgi:hypothetical protein
MPTRLRHFGYGGESRFDERRRDVRIDCIAVSPQESHAIGYPISQRECPGLNWPPESIPAIEPVSISPRAVKRIGPHFAASADSAPFA